MAEGSVPRRKLTGKQAKFVVEYLKDDNATQAAIRAGYSKTVAAEAGSENLRKPYIAEIINDHLDAQQARTLITADKIIREYARLGFYDVRRLFDESGSLKRIVDLDADTQAIIAGIDVVTIGNSDRGVGEIAKIRLVDRKGALDSLARHFGLFDDKATLSVDALLANLLATIAGAKTDVLSRVRGEDGEGGDDGD